MTPLAKAASVYLEKKAFRPRPEYSEPLWHYEVRPERSRVPIEIGGLDLQPHDLQYSSLLGSLIVGSLLGGLGGAGVSKLVSWLTKKKRDTLSDAVLGAALGGILGTGIDVASQYKSKVNRILEEAARSRNRPENFLEVYRNIGNSLSDWIEERDRRDPGDRPPVPEYFQDDPQEFLRRFPRDATYPSMFGPMNPYSHYPAIDVNPVPIHGRFFNYNGESTYHGPITPEDRARWWHGVLAGAALGALPGGVAGLIADSLREDVRKGKKHPQSVYGYQAAGMGLGALTGATLGGVLGYMDPSNRTHYLRALPYEAQVRILEGWS